jgi:hypothetical protein
MADDASNAPSEASKVQPKKETVRINLPPKPTAAPTVKIPAPAPAAAAPASAGATQKLPAAAPPAPKAPAAPKAGGAPRPAPAMTPRAKKSVPTISGADKGLAIAALVVSVAVVVQLFLLGS